MLRDIYAVAHAIATLDAAPSLARATADVCDAFHLACRIAFAKLYQNLIKSGIAGSRRRNVPTVWNVRRSVGRTDGRGAGYVICYSLRWLQEYRRRGA